MILSAACAVDHDRLVQLAERYFGSYAETGLMTIYAGTSAEQIAALADLTIDEMRRAVTDMTPAEVARARAQMKAGMLMGLESPSNRAERMARMVAVWGRVPDVNEIIGRIDSVTTGDIKAFGAGLADKGEAALALYGPLAGEGVPSLERLRGRLAA
jgi:predicted Zn-dependent peptidase